MENHKTETYQKGLTLLNQLHGGTSGRTTG
jgi:hypothetical protein